MKRLTISLLVTSLVLLGACRRSDMRTVEFHLPQVRNEACETRVRQALKALKGLELDKAVFDYTTGTLTLTYDSMVIANKNIEHAIIAVGFDANELKASPEARQALPPECRFAGEEAATAAAP